MTETKYSIGIIGANGHVGSEVCLYLSLFDNIEVVPICRSRIASAFLRHLGFDCRIGDLESAENARQLLDGLDLIADFTMPGGGISQIIRAYRSNAVSILNATPAKSKIVFMSTIMAFGPGDTSRVLRKHIFSRTTYGYIKRVAERFLKRLARRDGRELWVLRLGIVYGLLQPSSRGILDSITGEPVAVPDGPSYTVFCFTIAEALVHIAQSKETPGDYTVVSNPPYSWEDVYRFYALQRGIEPDILTTRIQKAPGILVRILSSAKKSLRKKLADNRELLVSYILSKFPKWEGSTRASYFVSRARSEIASLDSRPIAFDTFGCTRIPGRFLVTVSDPRIAMKPYERQLAGRLQTFWGSLDRTHKQHQKPSLRV